MPRRIDRYWMVDGKTTLSARYFNQVWQDLDLRLDTLEGVRISWEEAVRRVSDLGLTRINEVLGPAIQSVDGSVERAERMLDEIADERDEALAALVTWKTQRLAELEAWRTMLEGSLPDINDRFGTVLALTGGELTGPLLLADDPQNPMGAATRRFVDGARVPPGVVAYFAGATPPPGYLKANGAAVSRTTYGALFAAIDLRYGLGDGTTTFNLPDLRGYFLRGLDDGRGIDTGRALGSAQDDANKSHTHTGTANSSGNHTHTGSANNLGVQDGQMRANVLERNYSTYSGTDSLNYGGIHTHDLTVDADGGAEARPKNIALMACIKF
jgi:microcystin-dependent protein